MLLKLHLLIELARDVFEFGLQLGPETRYQRVNFLLDRLADVAILQVVEEVTDRVQMVELLTRPVHYTQHVVELLRQLEY